jgi:hypothetical protein
LLLNDDVALKVARETNTPSSTFRSGVDVDNSICMDPDIRRDKCTYLAVLINGVENVDISRDGMAIMVIRDPASLLQGKLVSYISKMDCMFGFCQNG